jgi:HSP20 family molecular chaperone IbpA
MNVPVRPADETRVEARLGKVKGEIRRRAWELYRKRGERKGTALEDWKAAEREKCAAPLATVAEGEKDLRVTVCVPDAGNCTVAVDALPNEIVVEAERNGEVQGYARIHLPAHIEPRAVTARLEGDELDVVARKANVRQP